MDRRPEEGDLIMPVIKFPGRRRAEPGYRLDTNFLGRARIDGSPLALPTVQGDLAEQIRSAAIWADKTPDEFVSDLLRCALENDEGAT